MLTEDEEFVKSLHDLTDEILARVAEVGLEQAAEEHWERAKAQLNEICDRNEAYRREHGIPEDEL